MVLFKCKILNVIAASTAPCRRCKSISTPHPHPSFEIVEWMKCWTEHWSNVDSSFTSVKLEMFRNLEDFISDVVWFMSEISSSDGREQYVCVWGDDNPLSKELVIKARRKSYSTLYAFMYFFRFPRNVPLSFESPARK